MNDTAPIVALAVFIFALIYGYVALAGISLLVFLALLAIQSAQHVGTDFSSQRLTWAKQQGPPSKKRQRQP
jgi:hypothetical protein